MAAPTESKTLSRLEGIEIKTFGVSHCDLSFKIKLKKMTFYICVFLNSRLLLNQTALFYFSKVSFNYFLWRSAALPAILNC